MTSSTDPRFAGATVPVLGAGWAFPPARVAIDGDAGARRRFAMAADEESVRQAIFVILSTARGERVMRPDFGCNLHEFAFALNDRATQSAAAHEVREALMNWEPRIDMLDVRASAAGERAEVLLIDIHYRVRSTDNRFNLVYPFYLDRPLT